MSKILKTDSAAKYSPTKILAQGKKITAKNDDNAILYHWGGHTEDPTFQKQTVCL